MGLRVQELKLGLELDLVTGIVVVHGLLLYISLHSCLYITLP